MEYKQREYPLFSACGLNCGLCPRYQMEGTSRCSGCSGEGFLTKHPSCGVLSCSQRKGLEYCYECDEYPCKKYDGANQSDSFITHLKQFCYMEKAKTLGIDVYRNEFNEKSPYWKCYWQITMMGGAKAFSVLWLICWNYRMLGMLWSRFQAKYNPNNL